MRQAGLALADPTHVAAEACSADDLPGSTRRAVSVAMIGEVHQATMPHHWSRQLMCASHHQPRFSKYRSNPVRTIANRSSASMGL